RLYIHREAHATFPHTPLDDDSTVKVGGVLLRALFTPGHTPEHVALLVTDTTRADEPWFVLTGDSLFVGDVGRPDLLGAEASRQLANRLYDSLHNCLMRLPDGLEVYPGHGAGSLCGKAMSAKLSSTIGFERRFNYALGIADRTQFVEAITTELPMQPPNVPFIKRLNREGAPVLGDRVARKLSAAQVRRFMKDGAVVVDTREPQAFGVGHVQGALNVVASSNQFATRVGFLLRPAVPIVFVTRSEADCLSAMRAVSRVGLDHVHGFLTPAEAKRLTQSSTPQLSVWQANAARERGDVLVLDVRERGVFASGHVPNARHIPLGQLPTRLGELPREQRIMVMCAGGVRSSSAASLLAREGFADVINVLGGFDAWREAGLPVER
ncbi:MAG: MBL fold metallo-hydrolase, partial [Chloroflexi bacterium]|nr:MBL fold metallo-hydrolase [Chloroflexota bacterium]